MKSQSVPRRMLIVASFFLIPIFFAGSVHARDKAALVQELCTSFDTKAQEKDVAELKKFGPEVARDIIKQQASAQGGICVAAAFYNVLPSLKPGVFPILVEIVKGNDPKLRLAAFDHLWTSGLGRQLDIKSQRDVETVALQVFQHSEGREKLSAARILWVTGSPESQEMGKQYVQSTFKAATRKRIVAAGWRPALVLLLIVFALVWMDWKYLGQSGKPGSPYKTILWVVSAVSVWFTLALFILMLGQDGEPLQGVLVMPAYIVSSLDARSSIPTAILMTGVIAGIASLGRNTAIRFASFFGIYALLSLWGIASYKGSVRSSRLEQEKRSAEWKAAEEQRAAAALVLLSDRQLDFAALLEKGGYPSSSGAGAPGRSMPDFCHLLSYGLSEPNVKRAVPILKDAIKRDEADNPGFTNGRAYIARTIYQITGKKVHYKGVERDLENCARFSYPDPYDGSRSRTKCTRIEEVIDEEANARRKKLSDPHVDFAALLAKNGLVGFSNLLMCEYHKHSEKNLKRAAPLLKKEIARDEVAHPRRVDTENRRAAARAIFVITGEKVQYLGVNNDIAMYHGRSWVNPFDFDFDRICP